MSLNQSKTEAMVISSSKEERKWKPILTLNGAQIKIVTEYKFLGVIIDSGLRFKSHVNKIVAKCRRRNNILRCLAGKDWGQCLETQKSLYLTYIRSAIEYASPAWYPWISKTARKRLERIQNESLRIMSRLAKTCPKDFLRLETGTEPLKQRLEKNSRILWEKYARLPIEDKRRQMMETEVKPRLKSRHGWRTTTAAKMKNNINRETPSQRPSPWRTIGVDMDEVKLEGRKEELSKETLKQQTMKKLRRIDADIEIYTDGSTAGDQRNGGAGVYIKDRNQNTVLEESMAAGKMCSSYDAECMALASATLWLTNQPVDNTHYLLLTDSHSLTQALKKNNWKDGHDYLNRVKKNLMEAKDRKVTICWIPSHCGVAGNEKADQLAARGTEEDQSNAPVSFNISKAKIRAEKWRIKHERASKIYEGRRKPKSGIEEKWPSEARRTYGRLRTGHAKELKAYRHFIQIEEDARCEECGAEEETIEHVLCECPALELWRRRHHDGALAVSMLVSEPEKCRQILARKFKKLRIGDQEKENPPNQRE
jgi:ribonuclease HI